MQIMIQHMCCESLHAQHDKTWIILVAQHSENTRRIPKARFATTPPDGDMQAQHFSHECRTQDIDTHTTLKKVQDSGHTVLRSSNRQNILHISRHPKKHTSDRGVPTSYTQGWRKNITGWIGYWWQCPKHLQKEGQTDTTKQNKTKMNIMHMTSQHSESKYTVAFRQAGGEVTHK